MLKGTPDAAGPELSEAALAFGLALPEMHANAPPVLDVWEENWPAVRLFSAMQTQLRVSFTGVEGFDYAALPAVEPRIGLTRAQGVACFDSLRVMERELIAWHNKG